MLLITSLAGLTLAVSVLAVSCLFASVFLLRYATERVERGS